MDRIVLGVDGSAGAQAAIAWCAAHLPPTSSELVVVHAVTPAVGLVPTPTPPGGPPAVRTTPGPSLSAAEVAEHTAAIHAACAPLERAGLAWTLRLVTTPPATALDAVAGELDAAMIVVGRRAHRAAAATVLGSVPRRLVLKAHCPVLVVPTDGPPAPTAPPPPAVTDRSEPSDPSDRPVRSIRPTGPIHPTGPARGRGLKRG